MQTLTLNEYLNLQLELDGHHCTIEATRQYRHRLMTADGSLAALDRAILHLCNRKQNLQDEETHLLTLDPVNAGTHYRPDTSGQPKYLYLIHPTDANGNRKREYIGAEPERQTAALARLQAHSDLLDVQRQIQEIDRRLNGITKYLADALCAAIRGSR